MSKYLRKAEYVNALQFDSQDPKSWPDYFRPWSLENYRPRDMSWGYVGVGRSEKVHVQDGDWFVEYANGRHEVYADEQFKELFKKALDVGEIPDQYKTIDVGWNFAE